MYASSAPDFDQNPGCTFLNYQVKGTTFGSTLCPRRLLQGKVARRAFVQESLKCVTSPTSDRKSPGCSFLTHFCSHQNEITLSICGDTSFLPSFLRSNVIFKAISHITGSKKWSKRRGTDRQTDRHTHRQTHIRILRLSCTKALRAIIPKYVHTLWVTSDKKTHWSRQIIMF